MVTPAAEHNSEGWRLLFFFPPHDFIQLPVRHHHNISVEPADASVTIGYRRLYRPSLVPIHVTFPWTRSTIVLFIPPSFYIVTTHVLRLGHRYRLCILSRRIHADERLL